MIPYNLLVILVVWGFIFEINSSYRLIGANLYTRNIFFYLSFIVAILLTGFRDMLGGYDVFVYAHFFELVPDLTNITNPVYYDSNLFTHFEPAYLLLNSLMKSLCNNKYFFFFAVSLVSYILFAISFYKYPLIATYFLIFISKFFVIGFIYIRQFVAMSIIWFSLRFLVENKKQIFLIFLLLATLFHYSAFVMLPLYFVSNFKFSKRFLIIVFVVSLLLGITPFIKLAMSFVNNYIVFDKLCGYANAEQSEFHIPYFIETTIIAILALKYRVKIYLLDYKYIVMFNVLVFYIVFSFLTLRDSGVIRFIWYYSIGYVILLPLFFYYLIKEKWLMILIFSVYFTSLYFRNVTLRDGGSNVPYRSFILKNEL